MKIIYSGGWNNHEEKSIQNCFLFIYYNTIKKASSDGKKIALVTLAKPDGYYNHLILPRYKQIVDIIDYTNQDVRWRSYDGIFLIGGNTLSLKESLLKTNFSLENLKDNVVLLGDSAGSYILSSYFYQSPKNELRGVQIKYYQGANPKAKLITIAHKNNPVYTPSILVTKVYSFARENGLRVLELNENEQKILQDGEFVEVNKESLF